MAVHLRWTLYRKGSERMHSWNNKSIGLTADSSPRHEYLLIQLERLSFGMQSPLQERFTDLVTQAQQEPSAERPRIAKRIDDFLSEHQLLVRFPDGVIARHVQLTKTSKHGTIQFKVPGSLRKLKSDFVLEPDPKPAKRSNHD